LITSCATGPRGPITLAAKDAELHGDVRLENDYRLVDWRGADAFPSWTLSVPKPGGYTVSLTYACHPGADGSAFTLTIGDQSVSGKVKATGTFHTYVTEEIGTVSLAAGKYDAQLKVTAKPGKWVMNLVKVTLNPVHK